MSLRLFFALWPDDAAREQLARWSRELRPVCGGRAVRPGNLHVTLAFLGGVEAARISEIERTASEVAPCAATLVLDRPGYWKYNRIAWAGASEVPRGLEVLVRELRGALEKARVAFDCKPFVPHVTLLRDAREPGAFPALPPIEWRLDGFALVESVTPEQGARYRIRRSWKA